MTTLATTELRLDADYALFSESARKLRSEFVMQRVLTQAHVQCLCSVNLRPSPLMAAYLQIKALARLPEDWDSYGALAVQPCALDLAHRVLKVVSDALLDRPDAQLAPYHIAPMPNGGLQIEWRKGARSFELWIDPHGKLGALIVNGSGDLIERQYLSASSAVADLESVGA